MHVIHAIELEKVGPFQKPVRFEPPAGVSVIYGLNRASGKASKNSNGVGKSLLMNMAAEVLYDVPQIGEKSDKLKQGRRAVEFVNHAGKKVMVRRVMRGKSDKLELSINGKEKEIRTVAEAKNLLGRLFPLTESDYRTYVSIDSTVPHPLVRGSGAERKAFMTEFFGLDKMDAERKLYAAELSALSKVRAAHDELRAQIDRMREDLLDKKKLDLYKTRVEKLKTKLRGLQNLFTEAQETTRLVAFSESMGGQIAVLKNALGDEITEELFLEHVKQIKYEFDTTTANIEEAEEYEQYKKDNARYNEAFKNLGAEAQDLIEKSGRKLAEEMAKTSYDAYLQIRVKVQALEAEIENVREDVDVELPEEVVAPQEAESDLETLVRAYSHQLEHAEKFSEGKCETCGQVVTIKDPATLKKRLRIAERKLGLHRKAVAYAKAAHVQRHAEVKLVGLEKELAALKVRSKKHRALARVHKEMLELPRTPKPFKGKKLEIKVLRKMMEEIVERRSLLKQMAPHLDTIIEVQKLTQADLDKVKRAEQVSDEMSELQERLSSYQAKIEMHRTVLVRVREAEDRAAEMSMRLTDEAALKHLVQGFQDKNMKRMAIEAISQRLMVLINRYAARVFPESFRFEFQWDTDIRIIVHRPNGAESSDVRRLSGAESSIFTLVLVCALLNFVPEHKRCSLLVLDEPSAHMSKEMTEAMYSVVKILNTMIPSIVIITPKDDIFPEAKPFTIVKEANGESRVVEGFPHQVK